METLPVHLFKSSFGPFVDELNAHGLRYQLRAVRAGVPMASGEALEIVKALGSATFWPALAAVVVAFINKRNGRKVIITKRDQTVVHAEGLSLAELEKVLAAAANITAIDPSSGGRPAAPTPPDSSAT